MQKKEILNLSYDELSLNLESLGEKSFRASQIFEWIYEKGILSFDGMKNLSQELRNALSEQFVFSTPVVEKKQVSNDGTMKFLFELLDGEKIETVLIPSKKRAAICVSTQVGCKFGCKFCASGIGGLKRNLSVSEILMQIISVKKHSKNSVPNITHIVFMGVGEPLDNYDNLMKAIRVINSKKGMNIAARRITISTSGIIPNINKLKEEGLQIELAVSLHGSNDNMRNILMPVNKKYPLKDLILECKTYSDSTKRQITFEYILIKDITCTEDAALELAVLVKNMLCKINLIAYNEVTKFDYETPSRNKMMQFKDVLTRNNVISTLRMPRGRDVSAACGQLRHSRG